MLMTSFLTPKTLSTGKVDYRSVVYKLSVVKSSRARRQLLQDREGLCVGACLLCVCVFVSMKLKCFVRQKQCFTTPMPDGRLWRRRRLLPDVPLSTHAHTDTHNHHRGRGRGGRINTQLIDRTNSVCKCFSSCWHSGAFLLRQPEVKRKVTNLTAQSC